MDYSDFLDRKTHFGADDGFAPRWIPDFLFDFQKSLVDWSVRKGRGAIFADCGLGKTLMQLVWAENVVRQTNGRVLILTPLAVAAQTMEEAAKFGIAAQVSRDGTAHDGITITNYEQLAKFSPSYFDGVVCDESSILKSFDGKRRGEITDFMRKMPYRLLCTATAAPNDFIELGTSSEALGYLGHMDMLGKFFKNDQNTSKPVRRWTAQKTGWASQSAGGGRGAWRFKGHAEPHFWRWVCSWARAIRRPSDLGFSDERFMLPELIEREHEIATPPREDVLFDMPAVGLWEERQEMKRTIRERCEKVAELILATDQPAVAWCHLNAEGRMLSKMIPGAVEVSGNDSAEAKEEAFLNFSHGETRVLIIKPKIGAWGLNWQHCAHMTFFPSHSFEQYYQAVRRSWRFGQTRPVVVDVVTTAGGLGVMHNLQRKAEQADRMFAALVGYMGNAMSLSTQSKFNTQEEVPSWL